MRRIVATSAAIAAALVAPVALVACGSDDGGGSATTTSTALADGSRVLAPVILNPDETEATVDVGIVVTFDMGDADGGQFVATSDDPAVFRVESTGGSQGSYSTNAGGIAISAGTAEVTVVHEDASDVPGAPTTFTITVE
jgi:hypothetical protein